MYLLQLGQYQRWHQKILTDFPCRSLRVSCDAQIHRLTLRYQVLAPRCNSPYGTVVAAAIGYPQVSCRYAPAFQARYVLDKMTHCCLSELVTPAVNSKFLSDSMLFLILDIFSAIFGLKLTADMTYEILRRATDVRQICAHWVILR
jgi:hypothetical protein